MKQTNGGFTLIELVVVIVILGILAAVAVPKFFDLSGEAEQAAVSGIAGSVASASSVNFAARKVAPTKGVAISAADVCTTTILGGLLQGGWPTGYTVAGPGNCSAATTESVTCTLSKGGKSATATVLCAQ